ncbi:glucose-1-phosphate adenylyltransferase [Parasulfuritortus cantonensis]|uniref:Glucose-1-phosphate adenylyltransferase n=1 Tax=Parasulfuritortus cantonensis TaxID=2528202 RepID=A0A4R1BGZ1_9PROT|nr:glucose-1-phosphate adenylyltransferase [Parasulfuritortus cantonensis]TCJ16525.1 glucose-1-phosphate adenylyltransferase [Parasulfuritortus cantonensis]
MHKEQPRFVSLLTKNTVALILAGGRGSRLKQLTDWRAKPAVPFGGKFRIVDFPLSNCMNSGIRRIGVITQYKAHSLIKHIQRGWGFLRGEFNEFVELHPASQRVDEDTWYRGTADAIYQNLDILRIHKPEYVLVLAGDHVYKMDYGEMLAHHARTGADMTVACIEVPVEEAAGAFGVMTVDAENRVTEFTEKPAKPNEMPGKPGVALCSMGIYVFNAAFLYEQLIHDADDPKSEHDFGKDIIPRLIRTGYRLSAHSFTDSCVHGPGEPPYWRDVGTVDAYWEANLDLARVTPDLNLYDREWPIWTHQEQLPPAKFVFDSDDRRGMAVDSMVSGGCIISGATVRQSVLFSNVRVHDGSYLERAVVLPDVRVGEGCVLKNVVIDKGCNIPDGTSIGVDHEADKKRYFVSPKGVTLITPEMLGQDIHHFR